MVPTAKLVGEFGDVNESVSRECSEMDSILSVHRAVSSQDGNHSERDDSSSSEVIGATEDAYHASDSSSDHGSVSVECTTSEFPVTFGHSRRPPTSPTLFNQCSSTQLSSTQSFSENKDDARTLARFLEYLVTHYTSRNSVTMEQSRRNP
ncbi:hypothetical protein PsorP6_003217 [Peronosclerospora sorghi]|uniref:Uncharacterized protein n=1 Tax=Peronosclerospora sorghi TaxID=230839 RepID=A0ACC0VL20_9STRA|nr:hypothetical protein PsorP6_003217 [Peronosclerospora sorghi]